jgi:hypothetical protein
MALARSSSSFEYGILASGEGALLSRCVDSSKDVLSRYLSADS